MCDIAIWRELCYSKISPKITQWKSELHISDWKWMLFVPKGAPYLKFSFTFSNQEIIQFKSL